MAANSVCPVVKDSPRLRVEENPFVCLTCAVPDLRRKALGRATPCSDVTSVRREGYAEEEEGSGREAGR